MAVIDREAAKAAGYTDAQIDAFERQRGLTPSQPSAQPATQQESGSPMTAGQVATGAVMNFPSSLGKMATDVYKAVTNPVDTITSVLDIGAGTLQKLLPDQIVNFVGKDQASIDKANMVKQFYQDRYGSIEGAKKAVATDPAGVLSDMSLFLTGGASLAPKAGIVSKVLTKGAEVTNPLNIAVAPIKYGAKSLPSVLGGTTGAGAMAVEEAFKAGKEGGAKGQAFTENMRGTADRLQVLEDTKANLQAMIKQQQDAYRSGMVDIKADQSILSFDDIDKALKNATDRVTYKGKVTNNYGMSKVEEAQKLIDDWRNSNPQDFHTPEGLDKLKQSLYDEVIADIPLNKKNTLSAVGDIYNSIKSTIQTQAPTYADTMKAYADTAEQVREIERALSQGKKATADAGMRKLQSVMRDNVNTNYGQRVNMVNQLEATSPQFGGGIPIKPALAGQTMSSGWPRGVQGVGTVGTAGLLSQASNPLAAAYLAASSPRIVGEASYLAGQGARQAGKVTGLFPELDYPTMFNLLSKAQVQ